MIPGTAANNPNILFAPYPTILDKTQAVVIMSYIGDPNRENSAEGLFLCKWKSITPINSAYHTANLTASLDVRTPVQAEQQS